MANEINGHLPLLWFSVELLTQVVYEAEALGEVLALGVAQILVDELVPVDDLRVLAACQKSRTWAREDDRTSSRAGGTTISERILTFFDATLQPDVAAN